MKSLEQQLLDTYIANIDVIGEGLPVWFNDARRGFLESLNLLSFPSVGDERYRHTNIRELFTGEWELSVEPDGEDPRGELSNGEGYHVNIRNGFCIDGKGLTVLDNGIMYGSLKEALNTAPEILRPHYNSAADNDMNSPVSLNSLFMRDGAVVYVPDGVEADKPFVLDFEYTSSDYSQMCFPRALVVMGANSKADVVISHKDNGAVSVLADFVRESVIGNGAMLNLSEVTAMKEHSILISGNYLRQQANSRADAINVWLRGGVTRVDNIANLDGKGCESNLYGLFFGTAQEHTDINMRMNHNVSDCSSFELIKGIVSGEAVGAFNGLIYVARDAQRTSALQQSRNLQMSDNSRIYTEPQLEIYADDVKCSHGATVGQMDSDAVFYMRQRGISEDDAKRLQLFGFVNDIISKCRHEDTCEGIAELARQRIEEL